VFSNASYKEKTIKIFVKPGENPLNEVSLLPAAKSLSGITVVAKKPLIEQKDDKIIFNVEEDPAAKTETAIEILRKTPFVSVDGNDNVMVNGQGNFKVLLNGRETAMFATNIKEALKSFPGSVIMKIEVITAPSAKYDAEGIGGIINIVTKSKVAGYNGSLSSSYRTTGWQTNNGSFNIKSGKFGLALTG
jgi:hypothetical protein